MKNPRYTFGREFILSKSCEFYYDDVTAASVINITITYGNVTVESIKAFHKQWRCVIRFLSSKQLSTNATYSKMHPAYCDNCFTRPAIHVWCKSLLRVEKVLLRRNDLAAMLF